MNGFFCLCAFIFWLQHTIDRSIDWVETIPMNNNEKKNDWDDDDNGDDDGFRLNLWDTNTFCALHLRDSHIFYFDIAECWLPWIRSRFSRTFVKCSMYIFAFQPDQKWKYSMDSPNERRIKKTQEEKKHCGNVDREMCAPFLELWLDGCHGTKWQREIGRNVEIYIWNIKRTKNFI